MRPQHTETGAGLSRTRPCTSSLLALSALTLTGLSGEVLGQEANKPSLLNRTDSPYRLKLNAELGILGVAGHTIQFGKTGTPLNYVTEGGQDNLYTFLRASADVTFGRHTVIFLFQPLNLNTKEVLLEDKSFYGTLFPAGTPVSFRYGFPFYRTSWLYDLWEDPKDELGLGLSLQIRNATIEFASDDGELLSTNRNIGPVPVLKTRIRKGLGKGYWVGLEADGFYAPVKYLNGDTNADVVGSILDASLRAGVELTDGAEAFVNLRYVGGGAEGTDPDSTVGDGFTANWVHFVALSLGTSLF